MKIPQLRAALAATALLFCFSASAQNVDARLWGTPVPPAASQRAIVLDANTRWVNVQRDEEVRFTGSASEFAWRFDGVSTRPANLRELAPAGNLARDITVYIASRPGHKP